MKLRQILRRRRLPTGWSDYMPVSSVNQVLYDLNRRLQNNLPRYRRQSKVLLENGRIQFSAKGLTLDYILEAKRLNVAISRDEDRVPFKSSMIKIPYFSRKARSVIHLEMARTESQLWS